MALKLKGLGILIIDSVACGDVALDVVRCGVANMRVCWLRLCVYVACMLRVCCVYVACMLRACCVHVACMLRACCVHVACMLRACCVHVACMLRACCVHVACVIVVCVSVSRVNTEYLDRSRERRIQILDFMSVHF